MQYLDIFTLLTNGIIAFVGCLAYGVYLAQIEQSQIELIMKLNFETQALIRESNQA